MPGDEGAASPAFVETVNGEGRLLSGAWLDSGASVVDSPAGTGDRAGPVHPNEEVRRAGSPARHALSPAPIPQPETPCR